MTSFIDSIQKFCNDPKVYFKIENTKINDIPEELINIKILNYLELRNCNLEKITKIPINLKLLNIKKNKLSNIDSLIFNDNLKILNFDDNIFNNLDFLNNKIEKLFISNNVIENINYNSNFDSLDYLNLTNNLLTNIDLRQLKNLKKLYISNNQIENIDNLPDQLEVLESSNTSVFEVNKLPINLKKWISTDGLIEKINISNFPENLVEINLEDNLIEEIIDMHDNIVNINLSNNNLKKIFKFNYKSIEYLNISLNNQINIPNEDILKFKLINLKNNGTIIYENSEENTNLKNIHFLNNRVKIKHDTRIKL